jgi:transposase
MAEEPPMPAAIQIPDGRRAEMEEFRRGRRSAAEPRRFLCVRLRLERGQSAVEIAGTAGWSANTVRVVQRRFIESGAASFADGRRGRRTPPRMSFQDEAFLAEFRGPAAEASVLVAGEIKAAWEARLGRGARRSTVYRMLKRHGWRKVAPRPRRPRQDPKAAGAFKKGATRRR